MSRSVDPLPTGIVTFLMTDIEGSTQAWQARPDTMTGTVSRHYEIMHAGISAHRGQRPEEQGEGDSVVGVFRDPADAVAAALETQLALRTELPGLSVRMSVHTGEAMLRNEDNYVGLSIIRCARIRSCGYGGQILISDTTMQALSESPPPDVRFVDLGVYGLRGLTGRDRIWQLEHDDLPSTFPYLKAGASAAGNLPSSISSFVGRRAELTTLSTSLEANRLVTITGPAGIGKSRLALAVADTAANALTGGAWLVRLSGLSTDDPEAVVSTILHACSIEGRTSEPLDAIISHFQTIAGAVIVIDGCEHAPLGASEVVQAILTQCPDTVVLATGRQPLLVPGEVVHELGPLPTPPADYRGGIEGLQDFEAAQLFIERATAAHPAQEFDDFTARDISRICDQLRGIPLGLELAAARVALTSIADLAASLSSLTSEPDRPVSVALETSIAWSYQFLDRDAQAAFRRLAVFQGSFEIDAATAVVAGDGVDEYTAASSIRSLLDQHLLTLDETAGRAQLPSAIRSTACERLEKSSDVRGAIARHSAWFADLAERFGSAGLAIPDSLLAPDEPDVYKALDAAISREDTETAYRILVGLGPRWHRLDREVAETAAAWTATRSPSDGEEHWTEAVSRLCYALADKAECPIHALAGEARAIAELTGDLVSPLYLDFRDAAAAADSGHLEAAERLAASARRLGVDEVTVAIGLHIAGAQRRDGRNNDAAEREQSLRTLLGGGDYQGPIDLRETNPSASKVSASR